jgi:hypothetical protein
MFIEKQAKTIHFGSCGRSSGQRNLNEIETHFKLRRLNCYDKRQVALFFDTKEIKKILRAKNGFLGEKKSALYIYEGLSKSFRTGHLEREL